MRNNTVVTVFGGTGFIGSQIVRLLAKEGWTVKVAGRVPERAFFLRPCGHVGQVVPVACDYGDPQSVAQAVRGADFAVNCVGILFERGKNRFARIHEALAGTIAAACAREGVKRLVHFSALGCEGGVSRYARSKKAGEAAVRREFPQATILRPSVVFGPGDDFFNKFAELARYLPALPLIGGGKTRFQPVYSADVAAAVRAVLTFPDGGAHDPRGRIYELGGPEILTFRELMERVFLHTGRRRMLVSLPWAVARIDAFFLGMLPRPLLTCDQVDVLKTDSIVAAGADGLGDLGIAPTGMGLVLPSYLEYYRAGGRFALHGKRGA